MLLSQVVFAQTKEELEQERLKIIKDIEATSKYLQSAKNDKSSTLKEVKAIQLQADNRKKLITNIKTEITTSDASIKTKHRIIDSLQQLNVRLKTQYADLLRYNYRQNLASNKWTYLLSAENLNMFLLRWRYFNQFTAFQEQKAAEINQVNQLIASEITAIQKVINDKSSLLDLEETSYKQLEADKKKKDATLKELSKKESTLQKQLQEKSKEREKLNAAIERIILDQMRASKKEDASTASKDQKFDTETEKLSTDFTKNKGKLPWPVSSGFVSSRFGTQAHPSLKGVTIENNGIDISSQAQQSVTAVFGGEVVGTTSIPGYKNMIIIRHGNYYSVYSNMESIQVKRGEKISAGQKLGMTGLEENNTSELHFELWKDKVKQNPESWLKRR